MDAFITWDILSSYTTFVSIVYMVVEFTKELKFIKKIPTKYFSFIVSFILLLLANIVNNSFCRVDIVFYILTAISISLGANGLNDFNGKKVKDGT